MWFNLEVDPFFAVLLSVMFGGFALALVDRVADMLVMRPWLAGLIGVGFWRPAIRSLVRPVPAGLAVVHRQRPSGGHPGPGLLLAGQKIAKSGGASRRLPADNRHRQNLQWSARPEWPSTVPRFPSDCLRCNRMNLLLGINTVLGAARVVRDHDLTSAGSACGCSGALRGCFSRWRRTRECAARAARPRERLEARPKTAW